MNCRHCHTKLEHIFLDLGLQPPSNAYLSAEALKQTEPHLPLKLFVCHQCWLVQTEDYAQASQLFDRDYAYFSSVSETWLSHAARYAEMITRRLRLGKNGFVIEIASNDGYLLKNFVAAGIPCLGIEPTASTAAASEKLGIPTLREFFGEALGRRLAAQGRQADLIIGNNVYAHVPDINDFTMGLKAALKKGGTITLEFPHLMQMIELGQFDTAYHEHFSYLSLHVVGRIFAQSGLRAFDVEKLPTHGGSLRVYGCHADDVRPATPAIEAVLSEEKKCGLQTLVPYQSFQAKADGIRQGLLNFLTKQKHEGKKVAAYGAAAKGNTLLNYAGIMPDLLPYVCDAAPSKQGKYLPGSHIPIVAPEVLLARQPDFVLILPWNIQDEIEQALAYIRNWGGKFVVPVPALEVL
jgi:SAM-dependent methyltransferase